jgi:NADH-ubiquinone oxidoreductase chain 1
VHCLLILLSVAFFTLFERKVIGLFHNRVGPNKVSLIGLVQPLLDAFKLLTKQNLIPLRSNKLIYNLSPQLSLLLALFSWLTMPLAFFFVRLNYSFLMFFCIGSVMVFVILLSGWSSNSKYSLIGSLRSIAQSISYEAVLRTILVFFCFILSSYSIKRFEALPSLLYMFIFPLWFVCILAETHRAPFDFSESESELVSGFNTEYAGAYFAFLFLSEYTMLLYACFLIVYIFFIPLLVKPLFLSFVVIRLAVSFLFI